MHDSHGRRRGCDCAQDGVRVKGFDENTNMMRHALIDLVDLATRDESGQDLLEYALLVALIALVAVAAITSTGEKASDIFQAISDKLVTP